MTNKIIEEALKEFDRRFIGWKIHHRTTPCIKDKFVLDEIKSFLQEKLEEAYKQGRIDLAVETAREIKLTPPIKSDVR